MKPARHSASYETSLPSGVCLALLRKGGRKQGKKEKVEKTWGLGKEAQQALS